MHPLVKKVWDIAQELDLTRNKTAELMRTSFNGYNSWLKGKEPQSPSIKKLENFIKRAEAGETFKPIPKQKPTRVPLENISSDVRTMYEYIYYLEDKYGSLIEVNDDDPVLKLLRVEANARDMTRSR